MRRHSCESPSRLSPRCYSRSDNGIQRELRAAFISGSDIDYLEPPLMQRSMVRCRPGLLEIAILRDRSATGAHRAHLMSIHARFAPLSFERMEIGNSRRENRRTQCESLLDYHRI